MSGASAELQTLIRSSITPVCWSHACPDVTVKYASLPTPRHSIREKSAVVAVDDALVVTEVDAVRVALEVALDVADDVADTGTVVLAVLV
jgi:hypothetical protein